MNMDTLSANWTRVKDRLRAKWRNLTDDDVARIGRDGDELMLILVERYHIPSDLAQKECRAFFDGCRDLTEAPSGAGSSGAPARPSPTTYSSSRPAPAGPERPSPASGSRPTPTAPNRPGPGAPERPSPRGGSGPDDR